MARLGNDGKRENVEIVSVVEEIHMCQMDKGVYVDWTENLKRAKENAGLYRSTGHN